jgi:hypothetical protein
VADNHGDAAQAGGGNGVEGILDEPPPVQRDHALGRIAGQVAQAFSGSGGQYDGLHDSLLGSDRNFVLPESRPEFNRNERARGQI